MNKLQHSASLLIPAAAVLSFWGCGGGGSGAPVDPLVSGRAALIGMASGSQTTTTSSLNNTLSLFQKAVKANPQSVDARFGEAVLLAGVATASMDGTTTTVTPTVSPGSTGSSGSTTTSGVTNSSSTSGVAVSASGPMIPAAPATGQVPPMPPNANGLAQPAASHNTLGLIWFMDRSLSNPYTLLSTLGPVTDLHLGLIPYSGYSQDSADVTRRQQILAKLTNALSDLAVVEANPNFTYTIPDPDQSGQTVTIGLPEVYMFDAYLNSVAAQIQLSLAYVRDPGNYQVAVPVLNTGSSSTGGPLPPIFVNPGPNPILFALNYSALDTNGDGKLEPNEYLPPSPFLTLRDTTMIPAALTSLGATASKEALGIAGVLARPAGGGFLIPNTTQVATALNNISQNVLPLIAQAAVGPVALSFPHYTFVNIFGPVAEGNDSSGGVFQYAPVAAVYNGSASGTGSGASSGSASSGSGAITGGVASVNGPNIPASGFTFTMETVTVNLAAWSSNPPADLKAFAPTYTLNPDGSLLQNSAAYPDLTFGGLFPNGLPADLRL